MISLILDLLKMDDYKGVSENIDIAKGKYKYPEDKKEFKNMVNRRLWQKKKK